MPVIGIVENMSGYVCPECGAKVNIFRAGGGKKIAEDLSVPYLGSIPLDPRICNDADNGVPFIASNITSPATEAFAEIVSKIKQFLENKNRGDD